MKRTLLLVALFVVPAMAWAEGRCPPGQYPIGDDRQGVGGCAPIPGGQGQGGAAQPSAPVPTGEWVTRWGAIAQGAAGKSGVPTAIGVSESKSSKALAVSAALASCAEAGGASCRVLIDYHNQCVALAGPGIREYRENGGGETYSFRAPTQREAQLKALQGCRDQGRGLTCELVYSACSMSEFRSFR